MQVFLDKMIQELKQLKQSAVLIGLETRTPIEKNIILNGLNKLSIKYPDLSETDFNDEESKCTIKNNVSDPDFQKYFRISKSKVLSFFWGPKVNIDLKIFIPEYFNCVQDFFNLLPINIQGFDVKIYFCSEWEGNHYELIAKTFWENSPFFNLFDLEKLTDNNITIRGLIDDLRIGLVSIGSDVSTEEIRNKKFKKDFLNIYAGAGQIRGILPDKNISECFVEHLEISEKFFKENFFQHILFPLDKTLDIILKKK